MNVNTHTLKLLVYEASFYLNTTLTLLGYGFFLFFFPNGTFSLGKICLLLFSKAQDTARAFPVHSPLQLTPQMFSLFMSGLWLGHFTTLIFFW